MTLKIMSDTITEIIESYAYEKFSRYFDFEKKIPITHSELDFLTEVWMLQGGLQKTWNYLHTHPDNRDASLIGDIHRIRTNSNLWSQCLSVAINRIDIDLNGPETDNTRDIEQYMSGFYLPNGKELTRIQLYLIVAEIHRTVFKKPHFFASQEYVDDFPAFKRIVSHVATLLVQSEYLRTTTTSADVDKNVQLFSFIKDQIQ